MPLTFRPGPFRSSERPLHRRRLRCGGNCMPLGGRGCRAKLRGHAASRWCRQRGAEASDEWLHQAPSPGCDRNRTGLNDKRPAAAAAPRSTSPADSGRGKGGTHGRGAGEATVGTTGAAPPRSLSGGPVVFAPKYQHAWWCPVKHSAGERAFLAASESAACANAPSSSSRPISPSANSPASSVTPR